MSQRKVKQTRKEVKKAIEKHKRFVEVQAHEIIGGFMRMSFRMRLRVALDILGGIENWYGLRAVVKSVAAGIGMLTLLLIIYNLLEML